MQHNIPQVIRLLENGIHDHKLSWDVKFWVELAISWIENNYSGESIIVRDAS